MLCLALLALLVSGCSAAKFPTSDHSDGRRFANPGKPMDKSFGSFLKWRLTGERGPWPDPQPLAATDKPPSRVFGGDLRISWVGHATVLLQSEGLNILTDPIWSERASPFSWLGPRRVHPPGITWEDLPAIDIVLVSHNHYDHLDLPTLRRLQERDRPRFIAPLGNEILLGEVGEEARVEVYDWGESTILAPGVTLHLDPMHHWSRRTLFDQNEMLWAAFTIATPAGNIHFVGDSGYGGGDYFRAARKKFGTFRLAILPIGDGDPAWFMAYGHMTPAEAVRAYEDLGEPRVLPIHYNTFPLADTGYNQPLRELQAAVAGHPTAAERFVPLAIGASRFYPAVPATRLSP